MKKAIFFLFFICLLIPNVFADYQVGPGNGQC